MAYSTESFDSEIVRQLQSGGVGLLPSDTIYGLSCRALDEAAVERLRLVKKRQGSKRLIVLIGDLSQLKILGLNEGYAEYVKDFWPGPLTLVYPAAGAPLWLHRGEKEFGVRLPASPELRKLITKTGPITSTSANEEGGEPVKNARQARKLFGDKLDFYVDGGQLDNQPSTLAAIRNGKLEVIRPGAVKID